VVQHLTKGIYRGTVGSENKNTVNSKCAANSFCHYGKKTPAEGGKENTIERRIRIRINFKFIACKIQRVSKFFIGA
jgi:hypothetical protein